MEEAKEREVLLQTSVKTLELQVQALTDQDHEVRFMSVDVTMTIMGYTWVALHPALGWETCIQILVSWIRKLYLGLWLS